MSRAATRSDDELAASWHAMMADYHRVSCALDRELQRVHGLTASEFEILQQLHAAGCSLRMHELGDRVHLSQSALSRVIAALEKDGLVARVMCAEDRRSVLPSITDLGVARYLEARPTQRSVLRTAAAERDAPVAG